MINVLAPRVLPDECIWNGEPENPFPRAFRTRVDSSPVLQADTPRSESTAATVGTLFFPESLCKMIACISLAVSHLGRPPGY